MSAVQRRQSAEAVFKAGLPSPELLKAVRRGDDSGVNKQWAFKPPAKKRGRPPKARAA